MPLDLAARWQGRLPGTPPTRSAPLPMCLSVSPAGFILLTYMPTFFSQFLNLDLKTSGFLSVLPYVSIAICANCAGWLADWLVEQGVGVTAVRKTMQTVRRAGGASWRAAGGAGWGRRRGEGACACVPGCEHYGFRVRGQG